jgi:dTDP-4-amino-4,6-dideoxygalactose transaminase
MQAMLDRGVATRRGIMCAHREPPYFSASHLPLPHSETAQDRSVLLPLFADMTDADQNRVIAAIHEAAGPG